ncbi:hypothetical protein FRX31_015985 [Thalictrum thalictroides]|uniref:NB-ARC domain-containing protein n=1 Tax=Thalictrum thalictroides TaxID=46969 RepID=A0A7J6WC44_THATH|nr:hypothetical protein FRX31_015985 [Thalictrum thalictroides]
MVLVKELLEQSGAKIKQILSSLEQDKVELEPGHFATRVQEILEIFQEMSESLQPVHHLCKDLDLESMSEFCIVSQKSLKSQGPEGEIELEPPKYEYLGVLLPSQLELMETIWKWFNDDRVRTIGIEGKTGMGKTWMARQLKDRAIAANLFDIVIWMDLNQKSFLECQEQIVHQLGLSITREPDEECYDIEDLTRAVALSLGKKRYLLVINDFNFKYEGMMLLRLPLAALLWLLQCYVINSEAL